MSPTLRNILAVLAGIATCLFLNNVLLGAMMKLIGTPEGFDPANADTYGLLQGIHFLSPFIAHAVPSFVGGAVAAWIAARHRITMALIVGGLHLLGGIAAAFLIPAPVWFVALDLVVAYMPMAWLGGRLGRRRR